MLPIVIFFISGYWLLGIVGKLWPLVSLMLLSTRPLKVCKQKVRVTGISRGGGCLFEELYFSK